MKRIATCIISSIIIAAGLLFVPQVVAPQAANAGKSAGLPGQ